MTSHHGEFEKGDALPEPEGEGGPLTEFDSEESPLSKVQVAFRRKRAEMNWYWYRNERCKVCTMMLKNGDCLVVDETSNPTGASPNRPVDAARRGTGRMHS